MYDLNQIINTILQGNALDILRQFPPGCIDMCVTSPPYFGKRDYSESTTAIWGGAREFEHEWSEQNTQWHSGTGAGEKQQTIRGAFHNDHNSQSGTCAKCGAYKGQLGLEPTHSLYIQHLVSIFEEVRRVLKPYGSLYVNLGDSYNNNPSNSAESNLGNASALGMVGRQNRLQVDTPTKSLLDRKSVV